MCIRDSFYAQVSQRLRMIKNVRYDAKRFMRWSFTVRRPLTQEQLQASMVMAYHSLEKGLAFSTPKKGFGQAKSDILIKLMKEYASRFPTDHYFATSINVLKTYHSFNEATSQVYPPVLAAIEEFEQLDVPPVSTGGTSKLTRNQIEQATQFDFGAFALSRYSVRHFADREIEKETIEQIVRWAQKTPSVCNRQSCKVHVFTDPEKRKLALSYQNGNRGFGHEARAVFIVTSDLQGFCNPGERFQCWIDGGMFAMSLLYAIHSQQLGACALNWSQTCENDMAMRSAVGIPDNEVVIMMMAIGHLPDDFSVAQSARKNLADVLKWH